MNNGNKIFEMVNTTINRLFSLTNQIEWGESRDIIYLYGENCPPDILNSS